LIPTCRDMSITTGHGLLISPCPFQAAVVIICGNASARLSSSRYIQSL
jgi:hypothetical protein